MQETPDGNALFLVRNKKPIDNIVYKEIDRKDNFWVVTLVKDNVEYYGAYDLQGKKVIPVEYTRLEHFERESHLFYFLAEKKGKTVFYDDKGNFLSETDKKVRNYCGGKRLVSTKSKS